MSQSLVKASAEVHLQREPESAVDSISSRLNDIFRTRIFNGVLLKYQTHKLKCQPEHGLVWLFFFRRRSRAPPKEMLMRQFWVLAEKGAASSKRSLKRIDQDQ
jgi:hypothetical protein